MIEVLREAGREIGVDEDDELFEAHAPPRLAEVGSPRSAIGEMLKDAGAPAFQGLRPP